MTGQSVYLRPQKKSDHTGHWLKANAAAVSWQRVVEALPDEAPRDAVLMALRSRWFPRDRRVAAEVLAQRLARIGGPFFIYGGGSHTRDLFNQPSLLSFVNKCLGCLDLRAAKMMAHNTSPWPMYHPDETGNLPTLPIVLSHHEYECSLEDALRSRGVADDRIISLYSDPAYGARVEPFGYALLLKLPIHDVKKRVAIVTVRPTTIVPVCMWEWYSHEASIVQFDMTRTGARLSQKLDYLDCRQSLSWLLGLLEQFDPDVIYVYDQFTTGNTVGLILKSVFSRSKIILEAYDLLRLFFDNPELMKQEWYWSEHDFALARYADPGGGACYDGVVTKEAPDAAARLVATSATHHLHFMPYVEQGVMRLEHRVRPVDVPRLVWAGSLVPTQESAALFRDGQVLSVFRSIAHQGLNLAIITGDTEANFRATFPDYWEFVSECSGVSFLERMPRPELIHHLSLSYDYGLLLNRIDLDTPPRRGLKTTFASKYLTYVAAGLPIIVSREMDYMAKLVETWGIGLVVSARELGDVAELLQAAPYESFKHNLAIAQTSFSAENHFERFRAFLAEW